MTNLNRLPGPIADVWEWQREGACRGRDSAQFFHPDGERGGARIRREVAAKALCRGCPVRAQCAAHALSAREPYGVWGGFTEAERLRLLELGWEDTAERGRTRVDVLRLEARLGLVPRWLAGRAVSGAAIPVQRPVKRKRPGTAQRRVGAPPTRTASRLPIAPR